MRCGSLIFASCLTILLAQRAGGQDPPDAAQEQAAQKKRSAEDDKRAELARAEKEVAILPRVRVPSLLQLLRFDLEANNLSAHTTLSPVDGEVRVITPDLPGIVRLRVLDLPAVDDPSTGRNFMFVYNDLTQPGSLQVITHVSSIAGRLNIARDAESEEMRSTIQLVQDPPGTPLTDDQQPVRMDVTITSDGVEEPDVKFRIGAANFNELRRKHPRELEAYLRPILRDLHQDGAIFAVDPRIAWQVLGEGVEPDPQAAEKVKAILTQLDADDFRQRESAMQKLRDLGQPAALVLKRMERNGLSAEQNAGIDAFLAEYLPLKDEELQRLRNSSEFLLDTMASDDPVLRRLAAEQLKQVMPPPVELDPEAPAPARTIQVQKLRSRLPQQAATRPGPPNPTARD